MGLRRRIEVDLHDEFRGKSFSAMGQKMLPCRKTLLQRHLEARQVLGDSAHEIHQQGISEVDVLGFVEMLPQVPYRLLPGLR